jgi:polyhydroxybutyrate depolymerase
MPGKLPAFIRRHKVALYGVIAGALMLTVAQSFSGSGDYSFIPTSTAPEGSSVVELAGERPAELLLPESYSPDAAIPLLINLHGYTGTGASQSAYTYLQEAAYKKGLAYIAPTGSEDSFGSTYWNATSACCDFNNSGVDDVAYIDSLIEKASTAANIDAKRIYLFGHSNGHFMSYAYLCSGTKKIAAIAGLAGAMDPDPALCKAAPNNILHIHGEKDGTILYSGGALFGNPYTSAAATVGQWQKINKCNSGKKISLDLLASIEGGDTSLSQFTCAAGSLEFWSISQGVHTPALDIDFANSITDWLLQFKS